MARLLSAGRTRGQAIVLAATVLFLKYSRRCTLHRHGHAPTPPPVYVFPTPRSASSSSHETNDFDGNNQLCDVNVRARCVSADGCAEQLFHPGARLPHPWPPNLASRHVVEQSYFPFSPLRSYAFPDSFPLNPHICDAHVKYEARILCSDGIFPFLGLYKPAARVQATGQCSERLNVTMLSCILLLPIFHKLSCVWTRALRVEFSAPYPFLLVDSHSLEPRVI